MKKIVIITLCFLPLVALTQNDRIVRKGLLGGEGTLAIGMPTAYDGTNAYVSGNLHYYVAETVSYKGELWFFLGTDGEEILKQNSTLFTSFNYHIKTKGNIDPYIGFGPGFSWTQLKKPDDKTTETISKYAATISPVASLGVGVNYYTKFAHLFIEVKYVNGIHVSDIPAVSLNELRIAFGFGWNINTIKKK